MSRFLGSPLRVFALTLVFMLNVYASPPQADQGMTPSQPRTIGTHLKEKGIPNFGQVTPNLYRGAQPTAEGLETLKKVGVDVVVDLRGGRNKDEEAAASKLGMQYVSIPSHCPFPKDEPFVKFLKVVRENPGKKIFVHCRLGDDRTGMAVAAYRMAQEDWSADDAMREMKAFGFSPIHHAMCLGLEDYEQKFPQRLKKNPAFRDPSSPTAPPSK